MKIRLWQWKQGWCICAEREVFANYDPRKGEKYLALVNSPNPLLDRFDAWMDSRVKWGRPFLIIAGAVTFVSILTMLLKHI